MAFWYPFDALGIDRLFTLCVLKSFLLQGLPLSSTVMHQREVSSVYSREQNDDNDRPEMVQHTFEEWQDNCRVIPDVPTNLFCWVRVDSLSPEQISNLYTDPLSSHS